MPYVRRDEFLAALAERDARYAAERRWSLGIGLSLALAIVAGADQLANYRMAPVRTKIEAVDKSLETFRASTGSDLKELRDDVRQLVREQRQP